MTISIDEAIQVFKAEILAQDWSLNERRAKKIEEAISCLKGRFSNRKAPKNILKMAEDVLNSIPVLKDKYPETIDFLKVTLAHVVSIYEDTEYDPLKEEKIFASCYTKFSELKKKIQEDKKPRSQLEAETIHKYLTTMIKGDDNAQAESALQSEHENGPVPAKPKDPFLETNQEMTEEEEEALDKLMHDLETSAQETLGLGTNTLHQQLEEFVSKQLSEEDEAGDSLPKQALRKPDDKQTGPPQETEESIEDNPVKECPPTLLRKITIEDATVAVQENNIAFIHPVDKTKLKNYLKEGTVPLIHFDRFMKSLSKQFKGSLSTLKDNKLKQLSLPVMTPHGLGLPANFDEKATTVLIVTNGDWNGVILCSSVAKDVITMVKFQKAKNGDIAGNGFLLDNKKVLLLNVVSVLRREGFMIRG